jgi:hypothetical protein
MMVENELEVIWGVDHCEEATNVWLHIISDDGSVWVSDYSEKYRSGDGLRRL